MHTLLLRKLLACLVGTLLWPQSSAKAAWNDDKGCLSCHDGIERFSDKPAMSELSCTECHQGNGDEKTDKSRAHKNMYANPADFRVVDKTCGTCHEDEVQNAKRSLHATMSGMISSTRYGFGVQDRKSIYATYAVEGGPIDRPGATARFQQIPKYDPTKPDGPVNTPGDDYLRNQCLRCHLWSDGGQSPGDYRASGCAACHVIYSDKGTYEGGDKAIDKKQADRPRTHKLTVKIPEYQCLHCHNRGGRTGVSYIGTMESDNYGSPFRADGTKQGKLHGKEYNHLTADVHYQKGMTCIDCHTKHELHGDGRLYEKKENAVEIRCEGCHGTPTKKATLATIWGTKLSNVVEKNNKIILTSKIDDKEHRVPQLRGAKLSREGHTAMVAIPQHMKKLECYACHAKWAPQCYGCHTTHDVSKPSRDWISPGDTEDVTKASRMENVKTSAFAWEESRSYLRWESPTLGINNRGKVSPFIPGCQVIYTQIDSAKKVTSTFNKVFTTVHETSGLMHNPIQPHTISKSARTCADCHMSSKVLGLGSGIYNAKANFPDGGGPDFELERIVDETGKQLQGTAHEGARPFNKEEQKRISRSGTCIACHSADPKVWQKAAGKAVAPTDELHRKVIGKILQKAAGK